MADESAPAPPLWGRRAFLACGLLVVIILVFFVRRLTLDLPRLGTNPAALGQIDRIDREYVAHPWLAYTHIVPGVVFLLGGSLQLSYRFRSRHYAVHRRMGRVVLAAGLISGLFALLFGVPHAFGGAPEAAATVVFGTWFLACLVTAYAAIRRGDHLTHRRWMIRAFAAATGVGTIRICVGIWSAFHQSAPHPQAFAIGFWAGLLVNVTVAEAWLRRAPVPQG